MAAEKEQVKSVSIVIRLGSVPKFEIAADPNVTTVPSAMKFRAKGISDENVAVLRGLLGKALQGYPNSDLIMITADGMRIIADE